MRKLNDFIENSIFVLFGAFGAIVMAIMGLATVAWPFAVLYVIWHFIEKVW